MLHSLTGENYTDELKKELVSWVDWLLAPLQLRDVIQWSPNLPKTRRSGKIMRRILRKDCMQ